MIHQKLVETLTAQFSQLLGGTHELPGQSELQQQVRGMVQGAFTRLDLVTRDEFDAQSAVLARTREKLEQLIEQVAELERRNAADAPTTTGEPATD